MIKIDKTEYSYNMSANKFLREFYLEWVNNYLTVDKMAEHNSISPDNCAYLIETGRALHEYYIILNKPKKETSK